MEKQTKASQNKKKQQTAKQKTKPKAEPSCDISQFQDAVFENQAQQGRSLCDIVYANLIVLSAVFLSTFLPVVSFALPFLVLIYFEVGLFGFIYKKESGQEYKFEELFVSFKKYIKIFCVFVVKMILIMFWSLFFLIPGLICFLNFSFSANIIFESEDLDARSVLQLSKELTHGYRWNIFFWMLVALASICVAITVMFLIITIFDQFLFVPRMFYIIFISLAGVLDFALVAVPMVELAIVDSYIDAKEEKSKKTVK